MKLELVSYKICPYVQRSVITLLHKGVDFTLTHIDPSAKPAWFTEISPLGKVPLLKVDDGEVLFESSVINEFVDEVTPGSMLPADPLARAKARAWIVFASEAMGDLSTVATAPDRAGHEAARADLLGKLARAGEAMAGEGPFFLGAELSLVDAAFAPLLMRLALLNGYRPGTVSLEGLPRVAAWSDALLALDAVRNSVVPELPRLYKGYLMKRGGHFGQLLRGQG